MSIRQGDIRRGMSQAKRSNNIKLKEVRLLLFSLGFLGHGISNYVASSRIVICENIRSVAAAPCLHKAEVALRLQPSSYFGLDPHDYQTDSLSGRDI